MINRISITIDLYEEYYNILTEEEIADRLKDINDRFCDELVKKYGKWSLNWLDNDRLDEDGITTELTQQCTYKTAIKAADLRNLFDKFKKETGLTPYVIYSYCELHVEDYED